MKPLDLQKRLIVITTAVVTAIFVAAMALMYLNAHRGTVERGLSDEQTDLNRNVELLSVMVREGISIDEVRRIVEAPWQDGSGRYLLIDSTSNMPQLAKGEVLLTSKLHTPDGNITVGDIVSMRRMLLPMQHTFNYFIGFLLVVLTILFVAIRNAIKRTSQPEVERQQRLDAELQIARRIQDGMLPAGGDERPLSAQVQIAGTVVPSKEVGGDFYYYLPVGQRLHFIVGDVSGKGIPAAIYMATALKIYPTLAADDRSPARIATRLNEMLCTDNKESMFLTAIICRLDLCTGLLEICNAGHHPPLLVAPGEAPRFLRGECNLPPGVMDDCQYEQYTATLPVGSHLLLYTDGVTEAENKKRDQLGAKRFADMASDIGQEDAAQAVQGIMKRLLDFTRGREQTDDITLLDVKYTGTAPLRLRPTLDELPRLFEFAEHAGVGQRCMLALEEAVVNVINYSGASRIDIKCQPSDDSLRITIADDGKPFDPTAYAPQQAGNADELQAGGQGIHLMKSLADAIEYHRENNTNLLTIITKKNGLQV